MTQPPENETAFMWTTPPEAPDLAKFTPRSTRWWDQFEASISNLRPAVRGELTRSSRDIAALLPDPMNWGQLASPFKGMVVGAVQSGKTGSMMGVAATSLDQGYRIVVVLAGQKDDLRQQTARRFNEKVLRQSDDIPGLPGATTLGYPAGPGPLGGFAPPFPYDTTKYRLFQLNLTTALANGQPALVVVKKNSRSLMLLRNALLEAYKRFGAANVPTLILDDECDEASVGSSGADKTIPSGIANLWAIPHQQGLVAFVGYTATSAANLLQAKDTPLFPSHFVYLLRYPGSDETPLQYQETDPDSWYTGGEAFYATFGDEPGEGSNFLISASVEDAHLDQGAVDNPSFRDALRAYFVSGAYRLALDPARSFTDSSRLPFPHSMLIHTSPTIAEHIEWKDSIVSLCGGTLLPDNSIQLDPVRLAGLLSEEETQWREWYEKFSASRERIHNERPRAGDSRAPITWAAVRAQLERVFANTKLRIVNSDEEHGSTLDFVGARRADGSIVPPQDIYTIVLGGSRLSRGITLEGLCVSYFARWTPNPKEDAVQQMSRWFGYRGRHLEFCRLFTTPHLADHLAEMHENDTSLRLLLADLMDAGTPPAEAAIIMRATATSLPTAKLGDASVVNLNFSKYGTIFFSHVETGDLSAINEEVARDIAEAVVKRSPEDVLSGVGGKRGLVSRSWSAIEIAAILDKLSYSGHNPDPAVRPLSEHHRPRDPQRPPGVMFAPLADPYQLAAYLRSWDAQGNAPRFNVGIAFGEMPENRAPFTFPLLNRTIGPDDKLTGAWTGRGAKWRGDAYFDNPPASVLKPRSPKRLAGADGLFLLYVVHKDSRGRKGKGKVRTYHTPTVGLVIPEGGPSYRWVTGA